MRRAERCGAWKRRGWAILIFIIPAKAGSQRAEVATGFPLGSDDDNPATVGSRPLVRRLASERMRSMAQADFNALWIAGLDAKRVPRLPDRKSRRRNSSH